MELFINVDIIFSEASDSVYIYIYAILVKASIVIQSVLTTFSTSVLNKTIRICMKGSN